MIISVSSDFCIPFLALLDKPVLSRGHSIGGHLSLVFQREIKQGGREGKVYSYLGYVKLIKKYS
jgi:hypothetical protein